MLQPSADTLAFIAQSHLPTVSSNILYAANGDLTGSAILSIWLAVSVVAVPAAYLLGKRKGVSRTRKAGLLAFAVAWPLIAASAMAALPLVISWGAMAVLYKTADTWAPPLGAAYELVVSALHRAGRMLGRFAVET
jgi:hypothetical protein